MVDFGGGDGNPSDVDRGEEAATVPEMPPLRTFQLRRRKPEREYGERAEIETITVQAHTVQWTQSGSEIVFYEFAWDAFASAVRQLARCGYTDYIDWQEVFHVAPAVRGGAVS